MLQQTNNRFGRDQISNTNVVYSKAQIVTQADTISMGAPLRLVFKNDNIKMIDVANTSICFTLNIESPTTSPLVLAQSAADLFSVVSIYWNGIQMNMQQNPDSNMLFRKILSKCNGKTGRITAGEQTDDFIVPQSAIPANTENAYSNVGDLSLNSIVGLDSDAYVAFQERLRLAPEVQRHYAVTPGATTGVYTAAATRVGVKSYSVKLGSICPELRNLQLVSPDLFKGSGLEINLVLQQSSICMMRPPVATNVHAKVGVASQRALTDKYNISDIFLSLIYHTSINPRAGFFNQVPFMSVYATKGQMVTNSCNHNFSLNSAGFVRGVVIQVNPSQMGVGTEDLAFINQFAELGKPDLTDGGVIPVHTAWKGYSHNMFVNDIFCSIGANQYPVNQSPPVSDKQAYEYILAVQNSEQIFGMGYSTTLAQFLTTHNAIFIPVNRYVSQGELFQFHMNYQTDTKANQKEANILVLVDRILEISPDGQTRIES